MNRTKMPKLRNGSKGDSNQGKKISDKINDVRTLYCAVVDMTQLIETQGKALWLCRRDERGYVDRKHNSWISALTGKAKETEYM